MPDVSSVDETQQIVKAAKFPPQGTRGYSGQCWSGGWGAQAGVPWIKWSNTEPLVGVMIENVDAVAQVDEILAVEGLDFALFGPADYSFSLGLGKPDRSDSRVNEALRKTITAARRVGKHVMYNPGLKEAEIRESIEMGVTMLELSSDLKLLQAGWTQAQKVISPETP